MKVRELIEKLQALDPELLVAVSDGGPSRYVVDEVAIEKGNPYDWRIPSTPGESRRVEADFVFFASQMVSG